MYNSIVIRNGEVAIKGANRPIFEKKLIKNLKRALYGIDGYHVYKADGRTYIDFDEKFLNPSNTISFGQDTVTMYYQPNAYFTGDKIQIFKLNKKYGKLTENIALYLISSMKKAFTNFTCKSFLNCLYFHYIFNNIINMVCNSFIVIDYI